MNFDFRRFMVIVAVAFLALSIWNNPAGTAQSFSSFLGDVGGWFEDALDKGEEFFRNLVA